MDNNYQVDINANVTSGESREGGKFTKFTEGVYGKFNDRMAKSQKSFASKESAYAFKHPNQAEYAKAKGAKVLRPSAKLAKAGTAVAVGAVGAGLTNAINTAVQKKASDKLDKEGVTNKHERDLVTSTVSGATRSATNSLMPKRKGSRLGAIGQGLIGRVYDKNSEIFVNGLSPEQLSILLKIIPETDMDALHEAIPGSEGHELAYIPVQTLNTMGL